MSLILPLEEQCCKQYFFLSNHAFKYLWQAIKGSVFFECSPVLEFGKPINIKNKIRRFIYTITHNKIRTFIPLSSLSSCLERRGK